MTTLNFSAGPAILPAPVMRRIHEEFNDFAGNGVSVMEISHRSKEFIAVARTAEQNLRSLLEISDDYAVLFLQGGATAQFAGVPMNLGWRGTRAAYVDTGHWSTKAIKEARRHIDVVVAASSSDSGYTTVPDPAHWQIPADSAYVHYTPNETIGGVEFHFIPDAGTVPLVADMSSTILSRPIDVSRFGVIYAGAQKNIGPAGVTVVIVKRALLDGEQTRVPSPLNYHTAADSDSMSNTPPVFAWYVAGLVFEWLLANGGLGAQQIRSETKAKLLYDCIDNSGGFYRNAVSVDCRSLMNVPFVLLSAELTDRFLAAAEAAQMIGLKGHRAVGGIRASIYNAMEEDHVRQLVDFMRTFQKQYG